MTVRLMIVCLISVALFGCHKQTESTNPSDRTAIVAEDSAVNQPAQAPATASSTVAREPAVQSSQGTASAPAPVVAGTTEPAATLRALTQAVRRYSAEKQRVPTSLNEVVAAGYVKNMPQAPPGKKFAINSKRVEVILVHQ